ncbi:protein SCAR2 isoform X1 [Amborella trichopoda]|uniref:Protein SCAR n=1 Tax=Amborella trichopoda TaxID=13333 RepID=W1NK67_AMBTC|nr:protein SCAR2 isoform X1 [Amborella trichopoda]ERM95585.1 hypothetical protein AMTR_s00023p00112140 [Amborella trichopoda]|eukprot:XP_006828169.1 protein SCAR2 isoform X1 [Amborella trichopoda]
MPLVRYQIRSEYGLADPEVYRGADKDDPEALLEGVAMAGLVGILRQLGDLAEFAAELFHDLHEEVMATAARGHDLMIRVQQLEAELPSVEKTLLSQTNQLQFAYTVGYEWHANVRTDENLITQDNMPRFILDSYEECRGPPRLFLLDRFDVAGAGTCLKRYSDPSFFKTHLATSEMLRTEEIPRKKARRTKKKGWWTRNGETQEAGQGPHGNSSIVHTINIRSSENITIAGAKLKWQMNGSLYSSSKSGRSYMECVLETPSPMECKEVIESSITTNVGPHDRTSSAHYDEMHENIKKDSLYGSRPVGISKKTSIDVQEKVLTLPGSPKDGKGQTIESLPKSTGKIESSLGLGHAELLDTLLEKERKEEATESSLTLGHVEQLDALLEREREEEAMESSFTLGNQELLDALLERESKEEANGDGYVDAFIGNEKQETNHNGYEDVFLGIERKEENGGGYESDDVASELDNYMDALTTMESEMETDSEYRPKHDFERQELDSDTNEEHERLAGSLHSFSEMETESEYRPKHDFERQELDSDTNEEHEQRAGSLHSFSNENSLSSHDWETLLKKDSFSGLANVQEDHAPGLNSLDDNHKASEGMISSSGYYNPWFEAVKIEPDSFKGDQPVDQSCAMVVSPTEITDESSRSNAISAIEVSGTPVINQFSSGSVQLAPLSTETVVIESDSLHGDHTIEQSPATRVSPCETTAEISRSLYGTDAISAEISGSPVIDGVIASSVQLAMPLFIDTVHIEEDSFSGEHYIDQSPIIGVSPTDITDRSSISLSENNAIATSDLSETSATYEINTSSVELAMPHISEPPSDTGAIGEGDTSAGTAEDVSVESPTIKSMHSPRSMNGASEPQSYDFKIESEPEKCHDSVDEHLDSHQSLQNLDPSDLVSQSPSLTEDYAKSIDSEGGFSPIEAGPSGPYLEIISLQASYKVQGTHLPNKTCLELGMEDNVEELMTHTLTPVDMMPSQCSSTDVSMEAIVSENHAKVVGSEWGFSPMEDTFTQSTIVEETMMEPFIEGHEDEMISKSSSTKIVEAVLPIDGYKKSVDSVGGLAPLEAEPSDSTSPQIASPQASQIEIKEKIVPLVEAFEQNEENFENLMEKDFGAKGFVSSDVPEVRASESIDVEKFEKLEPHESDSLQPEKPSQESQPREQITMSLTPINFLQFSIDSTERNQEPVFEAPHKSEKDIPPSPPKHTQPEILPANDTRSEAVQQSSFLPLPNEEHIDLKFERLHLSGESGALDNSEKRFSKVSSEASSGYNFSQRAGYEHLPCDGSQIAATKDFENATVAYSSMIFTSCSSLDEVGSLSSQPNLDVTIPQKTPQEEYNEIGTSSQHWVNPRLNQHFLEFVLPDVKVLGAGVEEMPPLPPLPPLQWRTGNPQYNSLTSEREDEHIPNLSASPPSIAKSQLNSLTMEWEAEHIANPSASSLDLAKPQLNSLNLEGEVQLIPEHFASPADVAKPESKSMDLKGEVKHIPDLSASQQDIAKTWLNSQTLEGEIEPIPNLSASQSELAESKMNGGYLPLGFSVQRLKRGQQKDPLIEAVASHDRSKLKKVTERCESGNRQKVNERDVLLEQIRTKSFNLRPTVATRPNIQVPTTNINVAAILEKANAIRQAFAGSDEDDDGDNWSDT